MKRISIFLLALMMAPCVVYGAPATTLSITPSAVDATTITASDENTRNNAISTWANAHDHNDIDSVGNTLSLGDGAAGNKTIEISNADSNKPYFRYDDTNDRFLVSSDGSTNRTVVEVTGNTVSGYRLPASPTADSAMVYDGSNWVAAGGTSKINFGLFTRDTTTASGSSLVTGVGFKPSSCIFYSLQDGSTGEGSIGFDNVTNQECMVDNRGGATGAGWNTNANSSIYDEETDTANYQGEVGSFNGDGFSVTWTRTSTPSGTLSVYYKCYR